MGNLYDYIISFKDRQIKDNTIEIICKEFSVRFICDRKIDSDLLSIDEAIVRSIRIRRYQNGNTKVINDLYRFLNLSYLQTGKIPHYSLNRDADNENKIFFETIFQIGENITLNNILCILSLLNDEIVDQVNDIFGIYDSEFNETIDIRIVQSNTKTRRLGYLKLIVGLFESSNYFPVTYLGKRIETDSLLYDNALEEYGNLMGDNKGVIKKTNTGSSAKPYIELLEELTLLTKVNNSYILTKQSKIYFHLNKELKEKSNNTDSNLFQLNILDKLFFLRQILVSDPLYIWVILDIIFIAQESIGTMSIKKLFVDYIKNDLDLNQQYSTNNSMKRIIIELRARISSWKKPLAYLEHIVEPRVNWLIDLGILELKTDSKEKRYQLSNSGINLMSVLSEIFEKNLNKQLILPSFVKHQYFRAFNYIFSLNKKHSELDVLKINDYLVEAFKVFKTDAPNRIAASQAIDYVCFKSFFVDKIIVEFEDVKKYLQTLNVKFSMDWFETENDGALYLRK